MANDGIRRVGDVPKAPSAGVCLLLASKTCLLRRACLRLDGARLMIDATLGAPKDQVDRANRLDFSYCRVIKVSSDQGFSCVGILTAMARLSPTEMI